MFIRCNTRTTHVSPRTHSFHTTYDGEGKRIKKKTYDSGVLNEETIFVYSAGKLIAEYSNKPPPQNPTTNWTVTDQLGSPRILVNSLGEVVSRRDFMPFGEEIFPDGTHRTTNLKYTYGDNVRQKFTGYQKDEETQLDFAEARMYQNLHARFTAVDPLLASGKSANPQSFNRYVYVVNNPLIFTDPTGLQVATWTGTVFTNGRSFSPNAFVGEKNEIVTGTAIRFVDATDGYSYSFSEAGSTLLGRTDVLNARAARMMPDATQRLVNGIGQPLSEAIEGMKTGAGNFGKGGLNAVTDAATGGTWRNLLGYDNPLALERTPYETPKSAAYGYIAEVSFTAWSAAAGGGVAGAGARSSTLSVVPETQVFRFSQNYVHSSGMFSKEGNFAGQSIRSVADDLISGGKTVQDVPVGYVTRNGINLIDNTRSALALKQAGVPMNQWNFVNRTGQRFFENSVNNKLSFNNLSNTGTNSVRYNGCTFFCQ